MLESLKFKNYLDENYYDDIFNAIKSKFYGSWQLEEININKIYVYDRYNLDFFCICIVDATISNSNSNFSNEKNISYKVTFDGVFTDNSVDCFNFKAEKNDFILKKEDNYMDNSFVPHISSDEYENVAIAFLNKYYPEYKQNQPIVISELLNRIGLKLEYRNLSKGKKIFGIICLSDCHIKSYKDILSSEETIEEAKSGIIFVDELSQTLYSSGQNSINFTIIHECVHWFLHRKYFLFNKITDNTSNAVVCNVDGAINNFNYSKELEWIEMQANKIAARILLPKNEVTNNYYKFIRDNEGSDEAEKLALSVKQLSDFYGVSIATIKIRLMELGNNELAGIYECFDNRYIEPYYFKQKDNETISYSISEYDVLVNYWMNSEFAELIDSGKYIYVDYHLCINDKKYLIIEDNVIRLSAYARNKIELCCIPFNYKYEFKGNTSYSIKDFAFCRKNTASDKLTIQVNYDKNKDISNETNPDLLNPVFVETLNELKKLPGSFTETLKMLMQNRNVTTEELSGTSGASVDNIGRLRQKEDADAKVETIIAICIGLKLYPDLSFDLLAKKGFNLERKTQENIAYRYILNTLYGKTIFEVNDFLRKSGLKPLN